MADRFQIADIPTALAKRERPTVTLWNRLEGRPRTINFDRSLRAEVRDALWMLTRQWQSGEFKGEDAGSPVLARMHLATTRLTKLSLGNSAPIDFDDNVPLETQVEQQPFRFEVENNKISLDLRMVFGQRWLKLITGMAQYADLFIRKYRIDIPNPLRADDAAICAHNEVWQSFAAVAERMMDGVLLYQYLKRGPGRHAYDGLAVLDSDKPALDRIAKKFIKWVDRTFAHPGLENPAWHASRLEYRFSCAAPLVDGEKVYTADQYHHGTVDWYSFDVDTQDRSITAGGSVDPRATITRTMIPVPLNYPGMPHPRWWTMEDSRTNFGEIRPDTTDLAKLLFIEFGLIYSNDWFIVPVTLPSRSIASAKGLLVTNVFGERFWIDAAGGGPDNAWQRWNVFTVNAKSDPTAAADTSLLFLPTVPKVLESAPLDEVLLLRDEMANMVWAIEKTIPAPDGTRRAGAVAGHETRQYLQRLVTAGGSGPPAPLFENAAKIRYQAMTTAPEHWIPFIAVRARGSQEEIELQRAALPRILKGDVAPPRKVRPRTVLLRSGLDQLNPHPYLIPEEEVPRAGLLVTRTFERIRWLNGKVLVWQTVRKRIGRGEGSSGLAFDQIVSKEN